MTRAGRIAGAGHERAIGFVQVDAFTDVPFGGNPAGVVVLDHGDAHAVDDRWRQAVAAEINVAETAFLEPHGDGRYGLRWFTPTTEVPLCGHATLASAHALWTIHGEQHDPLRFATASGELAAARDGDAIVIDLPAIAAEPVDLPGWWSGVVSDHGPTEVLRAGNGMWVARLADDAAVRGAEPDMVRLGSVPGDGLVLTAAAPPGHEVAIVSRYFAPHVGIPEDPVTGAAHAVLAPYWAPRLGTDRFRAEQASARGGRLTVHLRGDRVALAGRAVTTLRGEILV